MSAAAPDWPTIADRAADHARRALVVQEYVLCHVAFEMAGAEAVFDELDDQWDELERLHDRIRHQARRLRQKQATAGDPLTAADRAELLRDEWPEK